ncbi:hypothetical protein [Microbacterium sp. EST19A]|uniref:hypothetical protein n=1 Tax=Microbacterium sp. EST19A TaxID=2862681 RepID=UPI001CBDA57D|nr:hypothetical protein [Microbacterium sp. EST19A]
MNRFAQIFLFLLGFAGIVVGLCVGLNNPVTTMTCTIPAPAALLSFGTGTDYQCSFSDGILFWSSSVMASGAVFVSLAFTDIWKDKRRPSEKLQEPVTEQPNMLTETRLAAIEGQLADVVQKLVDIAKSSPKDLEPLRAEIASLAAEVGSMPRSGREMLFGRKPKASTAPSASTDTTVLPTSQPADVVRAHPDTGQPEA